MNYKLVVCDLDGTMLTSKREISGKVLAAVNKLADMSIGLTIATGRMFASAEQYIDQLKIDLPVISLNGTWIQKKGSEKPLFTKFMNSDAWKYIIEAVSNHDVSIALIEGDRAFVKNLKPRVTDAFLSWIHVMKPLENSSHYNPCEILIAGDKNLIHGLYMETHQKVQENIAVFKFPSIRYEPVWYLEFRDIKSSKGAALKMLMEHLAVKKEEILVIGDYYNDVSMFKNAGYSAVMNNAPKEVKNAADFVSDFSNDQDGVWDIMQKLILNEAAC
ncbi:HAD family phosphatase [bacterium]|nr:HAD family phosphatase [bacterium]